MLIELSYCEVLLPHSYEISIFRLLEPLECIYLVFQGTLLIGLNECERTDLVTLLPIIGMQRPLHRGLLRVTD